MTLSADALWFRPRTSAPWIIANLSFTLSSPGLYFLRGPNGSGKSLLLEMIAGSVTPTGGRLTLAGHPVRSRDALPHRAICRSEVSLLGPMTVREHLDFAARARRAPLADYLEIALRLGLAEWLDEPAGNLSLGSARKCWIAMSIAGRAEWTLLDEPFSGLDAGSATELADLLQKWAQERAVLLVDHEEHLSEPTAVIHLRGRPQP